MRFGSILRRAGVTLLVVLAIMVIATIFYLRLPWISAETVSFRSGDATLVGTLAVPRWSEGPYPAAVIVHGSGSFSRWLAWFNVRQLVPLGMAVLIYDKRGVGDSTGVNPQHLVVPEIELKDIGNPSAQKVEVNIEACGEMFEILAGDALSGAEWLRTRAEIDASRIGLVGASQAGWIMPLAASRDDGIAFIVAVAGPAVTCGIENYYSELTGEMPGTENLRLSESEMDKRLSQYDGPDGYDPVPVLGNLRVPSLWLLGGRDESVPTSWTVRNLQTLIDSGAPIDIRVYPEGNHMLSRPDADGNYRRWSERYDYWVDIQSWLVEQDMLQQ